jgi:excinuclease UvrABC nuclease subunit
MKKYRRVSVYKEPGKTNISDTRKKPGVYLIYKDRELVYIGSSASNLYKALLRHFQKWNDPTQVRITYPQRPIYKVSIVQTTPKQSKRLEMALIKRLKPRDNPNKYNLFTLTADEERANRTFLDTLNSGEAPF